MALIDTGYRRRFVLSVVLSALLATLETSALALLYALVNVASHSGPPAGRVADIGQHFSLTTKNELLTALGIALCVLYVSKAVLGLILRRWTIKVLLAADSAAQARLFSKYLTAPLSFHLGHNSAALVRNLTQTIQDAVGRGLNTISLLASDTLTLIAILVTAFAIQPIGALVSSLYFLILGLIIYKVIRPKQINASLRFMKGASSSLAATNQSFGAIREITVAGKGDAFSRLLAAGRADVFASQATTMFYSEVPRLVLEVGVVLGAAPIIVLVQSRSTSGSSASIALFAAVAFRALPTVSRVLALFGTALYSGVAASAIIDAEREVTDAILVDETEIPNDPVPQLHFDHEIVLDDVSFRYGAHDDDHLVIEAVSLSLKCGEYVGLIGESGSGKSTLLDLIVGLQRPTSGRILVDGIDIRNAREPWREMIGYVPQHTYILDRSVLENVAFGELVDDGIDHARVWDALEAAHLGDVIRSLPNGVETPLGERGTRLSGGQQQRIGIARAIYRHPRLLVLDEATSALDMGTEREILSAIEELAGSVTIVVVTHRLASLKRCDRLFAIKDGGLSQIDRHSTELT